MTDYTNSSIYKIHCSKKNITKVYIGSTNDLDRRKKAHKSRCENSKDKEYNKPVYKYIRDHGGFKNWIITELEQYSASDKYDLLKREREYIIRHPNNLNKKSIRPYNKYFKCDCGSIMVHDSKWHHKKTQKHISYINNMNKKDDKTVKEAGKLETKPDKDMPRAKSNKPKKPIKTVTKNKKNTITITKNKKVVTIELND